MFTPSRRHLLAGMAGLALPASLARAQAGPPLNVGLTFLTSGLDPSDGNAGWALVSHGVAEQLFTVDRAGRIVPQLAESAARDGPSSWTVRLASGRRFQDGTPVTAADVAAGLNRSVEANAATRASAGRLAFTAVDTTTLRVATERSTPVLPSILAEWAFAVAKPGASEPVFTGPYRPRRFTSGARLELAPSEHHPSAPRVGVDIRRFQDGQALALAFRAGELDLAFNLPVESLAALRGAAGRTVKSFPVAYQYMAFLNTRRPGLADARVRQAIARTLDRAEIARALRAGRPSASLWATPFPFAGTDVPRPDLATASRLLNDVGWPANAEGARSRDGASKVLTVWAYPQRPDLVAMLPVVRAQLGRIGITIETRVTEQPLAHARSGDFDIMLWAQHTAPAGDPGFFPGLFLATGGGNTFTGWSDTAMDGLVRQLAETDAPAARVEIARRIDARVATEAPIIPLVTPEWHVGLSARLAAYEPWGSDYYIVRSDMGLVA